MNRQMNRWSCQCAPVVLLGVAAALAPSHARADAMLNWINSIDVSQGVSTERGTDPVLTPWGGFAIQDGRGGGWLAYGEGENAGRFSIHAQQLGPRQILISGESDHEHPYGFDLRGAAEGQGPPRNQSIEMWIRVTATYRVSGLDGNRTHISLDSNGDMVTAASVDDDLFFRDLGDARGSILYWERNGSLVDRYRRFTQVSDDSDPLGVTSPFQDDVARVIEQDYTLDIDIKLKGHVIGGDFGDRASVYFNSFSFVLTIEPVPAPGAMALLGAAGLIGPRRRRRTA